MRLAMRSALRKPRATPPSMATTGLPLFVSPYQNHELMRQICEQMAEKYGVEYLHRDFSPRFREGQDKARELGLYMQNYCGCVFSEEDRYRKRKKKKKPDAAQA